MSKFETRAYRGCQPGGVEVGVRVPLAPDPHPSGRPERAPRERGYLAAGGAALAPALQPAGTVFTLFVVLCVGVLLQSERQNMRKEEDTDEMRGEPGGGRQYSYAAVRISQPTRKATNARRGWTIISVSEMATVNRTSDCGEVVMLGSPDEKNGALTQALLVFCT